MYFKRLEMHGFKSFADPVVIEFHEGVTCIVGPNGSGKSNISDAIRWVLGEQSPKALRGGKMEEVIFAGTASRKSRGMAEVTLVIDNSAEILDIDYNEVAITRRMYRSGESEYLINNNQCRLRDIRELIMDTGIGVDGYSLIGQGKIADIVSNKPESRREIFEEAAGVVMYKNKKAEAERKLESTGNNLDRVDDIISEIEGRIGSLAEDSAKAKEYLSLKERYRELEINIILRNIDNIVEKNHVYQGEIKELSTEIEEIALKKKAIESEAEEGRQRNENLERLGNEARDKLLHIVEEINTLTNRRQLNQERLSGIEKDTERLNYEISELKERLSAEEKNLAQLVKSGEDIEKNYRSASDSLQESIQIHGKITEEASELADAADRCREEMFRLHNLAAAKNSEAKSYESIQDTLLKRKKQLLAEAEGAEENREEIRVKLMQAEEESRKNGILIEQCRKELSDLHKEKDSLTDQKKKLSLKAEEVRLLGGQKVSRKKTIEEMEHNYEGYNYAVKYIMRSEIPGIRGVVAELMEVPKGFETAVETALGSQMQNIVCDTDESAKKAVSLLKKNRAGRLTFLPTASIKGSRIYPDSTVTEDSGYCGLAADCITCGNEYRTIFDYLLGKVVVAADMESAIRMSKKSRSGFRFVTLDGEIINISGAITGGRYKNKTANLLERRNEIASLETEIKKLSEESLEIAENRKKLDVRIAENDEKTEKLADSQRQAELASALSESNLKALRETLERISSSREKFDTELSTIERDSADAETTIEKFLAEAEKAKESAKQMESKAEEILEAYEAKKTVLEQASEKITAARIAAAEWESKQSNLESLLARIRNSAEDYAFRIETKENEMANICAEKNEILFGADGTLERTEKLIAEKQETEDCIEKTAAQREALSAGLSDAERQQKIFGDQLNRCRDGKYQLEIKIAKNETQLDTLKEKLWEEFEVSYAQAEDLRKTDFAMGASVKESREIRGRLRDLGEVNVGAIKEYESVSRRYEFLTGQRKDIVVAMDELAGIINEMDTTIKTRFKENFDQVVDNFEVIFRELFGGGHAELSLEDENNPLESGIDIVAQPPGKKLQNINLMSGGEKTMTAIALMFAVLKTKPTPFCILDEVEAALDDANIDRFSRYLRKFDNIQFALVTHQKATMEHADVLYGVTMPEQGVSKVLSLRLGDDFEI